MNNLLKGGLAMTANQIKYLEYREAKRSNQANERQTALRDQRNYHVAWLGANETFRHNRATERNQADTLAETIRRNKASENLTQVQFGETARHNVASEQLTKEAQNEQRRANIARETENARHNLASENENERSNKAREAENVRSNNLTAQANRDRIGLGYAQVQLGYAQDLTNQDRNAITSNLGILNARETSRANVAREKEAHRHNVESELQESVNSDRQYFQSGQSLAEQRAHNDAMEKAAAVNAGASAVRSIFSAFSFGVGKGQNQTTPTQTQNMPTMPNEYVGRKFQFGG